MTLEGAGDTAPHRVLGEDDLARIRVLRQRYPSPRSAILPVLWMVHEKQGILTAEGMREVARAMEMPAAMVEAVASFYSMFFFRPHGRYLAEVCTGMSCLVCGSGRVLRRFEEKLGIGAGQTTPDELVTLLEVECIGACGGAPAMQLNHRFVENLDDAAVDAVIAGMRNASLGVERFHTGGLAARDEQVVNLRDPGANRMAVSPDGAAGPVVDLVKGQADEDLPAQYQGRR